MAEKTEPDWYDGDDDHNAVFKASADPEAEDIEFDLEDFR